MTMLARRGAPDGWHPPVCTHCKDAWTWVAVYHDNTGLFECEGSSASHAAWAHIDVPRVQTMVLLPRREGLSQLAVRITHPSMRPVFFRRRAIELNLAGQQSHWPTVHCLGYEWPDGTGSYTFAFEDGSVVLTANRNEV